jgi:glycosyltransferase involved in cell wall biosynthesis
MTERLAVSLDATAVPADPRGAGRYVIELAGALDAAGDVDVSILCRRHDADRWHAAARHAKVIAAAPAPRPLRLVWEQARLPRLLDRLGVAVHHGPHYTMPERARVPRVVTVHDLTFFDHPEWHERSKVAVFRRAIRGAADRADALICVSATTAARLDAICSPRAPVHVVPHGVDHRVFRPDEPGLEGPDLDVLAAHGIRPPYVAFVGTIEPRKDVPGLVTAFDRVAPSWPDLSLVVAGGGGWGERAAATAIASARHRDRIVRPGYLDDDVVPALLRRAAVVAYPSLEEGFGLPALEALACGAPLVTSTGSAMEEVAGDAALLVAPGDHNALADAMAATLTGGPEVEARCSAGLSVAARHTWAASAAAHADVYWSVRGVTSSTCECSSPVPTGSSAVGCSTICATWVTRSSRPRSTSLTSRRWPPPCTRAGPARCITSRHSPMWASRGWRRPRRSGSTRWARFRCSKRPVR